MSRLHAAQILIKLLKENRSFADLKVEFSQAPAGEKPLTQELAYGVARWYFRLSFIADSLLQKPIKKKDFDIYVLILLGLYQILFTRIPDHAALCETVNAARLMNKEWATKLVNGVLRNFVRNQTAIESKIKNDKQAWYAHPTWLIEKISTWDTAEKIFEVNNQYPPLCLRVNEQETTREAYMELLAEKEIDAKAIEHTSSGIELADTIELADLPHFSRGMISIQDGAAQLAAPLLEPQANELILDACAAPGGKTCHILELQPNLKQLVALDNSAKRLKYLNENLDRLNLTADLVCHDVTDSTWWQGELFDKILLDAPCSSVGVIRRHPDIKLLRRATDIPALVKVQYRALEALWKILKPGGLLLYVTCSILPEENEFVGARFIASHEDCQEEIISASWGMKVSVGRQILPGMVSGMDGFYYAKLRKRSKPIR